MKKRLSIILVKNIKYFIWNSSPSLVIVFISPMNIRTVISIEKKIKIISKNMMIFQIKSEPLGHGQWTVFGHGAVSHSSSLD